MKTKEDMTTGSFLNDEEIVEYYWERNERAIEETSKKYGKYLYRIAYNIVKDHMDSEECLNDTYLRTWNGIPPARPKVLQVFLAKITRNLALDRFRHKMASKRVPSEMLTSLEELDEGVVYSESVEEEFLVSELSRVLNAFLRSLSAQNEFIFICRYYYSDSIEHISEMLGMNRNAVSRELSAMREALRKKLEEEGTL